ncbi:MAG TPA: hypothetical protein VFS30_00825 [Dehalococcoidia bacterium]|nr:hypothetical protein [Dehalococcoidia bacterium]
MSAFESPRNAAQAASPRASRGSEAAPEPIETSISTTVLTRILILLIAVWSLLAGLVLVFFQGTGSGSLGAGVEDIAGQRLLGAHLIVLAPVYGLIAWHSTQYKGLFWLPFASQLAVFFAVGYSILIGDTEFGDGMVAVTVSAIFVCLLGFVWISEQRTLARMRLEGDDEDMPWLSQDAAAEETPDGTF